ncbi:MAG: S8 family serine peptidase [Blastocatellia bacterium]|nr:S8 family serine peptidase [Blastocatellia bacterium]
MNRSNIWIHSILAAVLVVFAAVIGQIDGWRVSHQRTTSTERAAIAQLDITQESSPEVFVRFRRGTSLEQIKSIAASNNDRLADEYESVSNLVAIDDLDNVDPAALVAQYAAMPNVEYAEANFRIELDDPSAVEALPTAAVDNLPAGSPSDPLFGEQWALNNSGANNGRERADIDAIRAWETTQGSEEVVVAVLDSGVDYNHPDLVGNMWTRPASLSAYSDDELGDFNDLHGFNGTDRFADPMDDNGHGTHCAGIIGAEGDNGIGITGVNWRVQIMPLKFMGRSGYGSVNDAIEAINYAIDRKKNGVNLRIISASFGSARDSRALRDAINAAGDAGILFVAAAGNDSSNNDRWPHYPSNYDLPNLISVAALDRSDRLASFSNYAAKSVHVAAPGKAILSTWLGGRYREASGTSMATPYVAGTAALIIANQPNISVKALRDRLLGSADEIETINGKVATSSRVCAANALGMIVKGH